MSSTILSPCLRGLYDYLAWETYQAVLRDEISVDEIEADWLGEQVRWSFTWEAEFTKLNQDQKAVLASNVYDCVECWLYEDQDKAYDESRS